MSAALQLPVRGALLNEPDTSGKLSLLHVLTCGSVDDGKSTLLGRLLFDSHAVLDDQLAALDQDSRRFGAQGRSRNYALLVDGLSAEREQGITIDVAYRYFSTDRRAFIIADTPGHEQYTRNMAMGASTAELAIILVDARKGILPQTRRHSYIVGMLGVPHVVVAVNKMDLVEFDQKIYQRIVADYRQAVESLGFTTILAIPICARDGDNIASRSENTPWYDGPNLLEYLETKCVEPVIGNNQRFRFPVQWVNRPTLDFRGYAGTIAGGTIKRQQSVVALPSGQRSRIANIITADGVLEMASVGQAITLTLTDEIDISRGDVIVPDSDPIVPSKSITARVLWMANEPLAEGESLLIRLGTAITNTRVVRLHHAIDIHSFETLRADMLLIHEIGVVELAFDKLLVAEDYVASRELGAFVLIDRMTNQTVALGVVEPLPRLTRSPAPLKASGRPEVFLRFLGQAGSPRRALFYRHAVGCTLAASAIWIIVIAGSGGLVLATLVALAQIVLTSLVDWLMSSWFPAHPSGRMGKQTQKR